MRPSLPHRSGDRPREWPHIQASNNEAYMPQDDQSVPYSYMIAPSNLRRSIASAVIIPDAAEQAPPSPVSSLKRRQSNVSVGPNLGPDICISIPTAQPPQRKPLFSWRPPSVLLAPGLRINVVCLHSHPNSSRNG
ncbi:hypothetical protein EJ06DRAFT_33992 [Trichodelitschia bisporula]|uniref:Uncharacterized protein n=1 Tax=Trichodelitschia bisporula TaxID=703511 RepID=A0A6G1HUN0_9PEZI|nr:hypothetical protein EJ06DRAFT_33992 [Trichodelitschia bisporula]